MALILLVLVGCGLMVLAAGILERFSGDEPPDWLDRFL